MSDDEFGAAWPRSLERIQDRLEPAGVDCGQQFYKQRIAGRSLAEIGGEDAAKTFVLK